MTIDSVGPFIAQAKNENKSLGQIMIEHEATVQGVAPQKVIDAMKKIWLVMVNSIKQGELIIQKSPSGMSGGNAKKLLDRV
ncbi:MAG: hypothetical protein ACTSSH_13020, partial [Candidatus Heimdallarchaeota archaeon]